ncbi:MAG: hypothetical protein PHU04_01785 [Candidatus Peribacteraceae bacterium]|nr:hypothetical protein [Candidatus Peribacteraceae bacterium]
MPELHPHWQSTNSCSAEERKDVPHAATPSREKHVARYPAALVGIGLVCALSFGFFRGLKNITAQLVDEVTVYITEDGFDPADISVLPGASIAWVNTTTTPAILSSDTLCESGGSCLYSSILFESDTWRYDVPEDAPMHTQHTYTLTTGSALGTITIGSTPTEQEPVPEPAEPAEPAPTEDDVQPDLAPQETALPSDTPPPTSETETTEAAIEAETGTEEEVLALLDALQATEEDEPQNEPAATEADTPAQDFGNPFVAQEETEEPPVIPTQTTGTTAEIPRNPYTVGSSYVPTPSASLPQGTDTLHAGAPAQPVTAHKPLSQPETGAGIWILVLSLSCALGYVYWRNVPQAMTRL